MLKRKAFWLLLASGIVLPFNCIPSASDLLRGFNTTTLMTQLQSLANQIPALAPLVNLLRQFT